MTPENTPRMAERTDRQAQIDPWKRVETYVSDICLPDGDMFDVDVCLRTEVDAARSSDAALLRERDAQIASLTAQVEQQTQAFEDECGRHEQTLIGKRGFAVLVAQLGAERDAAQQEIDGWVRIAAQDADDANNRLSVVQQEAQTLREALKEVVPFVATQRMACCGTKCRELWCESCFGEEEAEAVAEAGRAAALKASTALASSPRPQATETKPGIFVAHESTSVFARPQEPQPAEPKSSETRKPVVNLMEALKKSLDSLNAKPSQEPGGHQP